MTKHSIHAENAEFQVIQALKLSREKRAKAKEVFIEGIESIKQAAAAGLELTRIVAADLGKLSAWSKDFIDGYPNSRILEMSPPLYRKLCDREEPSELLVTAKIDALELNELALPEKPFVLVFDRPSDCGNFGSLIRSANCFGADAVLVIGHAIDIFDPKTIRASLGSVFHSKIVHIHSMRDFEEWLVGERRKNGISLIGTDSAGEVSLADRRVARPVAIVLGNEAKGMSLALKGLCDCVVRIPIAGAVNSLNVACAGSILLWEVSRNMGSNG
jgi:tRNA G18 (ribose-2'-O)-methylase SpoU